MPRAFLRTNHRVEIEISGMNLPPDSDLHDHTMLLRSTKLVATVARLREELKGVIAPHDEAIRIVRDDEPRCSHCGSDWTAASTTYNDGCCVRDEWNAPVVDE